MVQHMQRIWLQRISGGKMVPQANSCQQTWVIWWGCRELVSQSHTQLGARPWNVLNVSRASLNCMWHREPMKFLKHWCDLGWTWGASDQPSSCIEHTLKTIQEMFWGAKEETIRASSLYVRWQTHVPKTWWHCLWGIFWHGRCCGAGGNHSCKVSNMLFKSRSGVPGYPKGSVSADWALWWNHPVAGGWVADVWSAMVKWWPEAPF